MGIGTPTSLGTSTSDAAAGSYKITTTAAITVNNLAVVAIAIEQPGGGSPATITGVSDGTNIYSPAGTVDVASIGISIDFWYVKQAAHVNTGASLTATLSATPASARVCMAAAQVSGAANLDPAVQGASQEGGEPSVTTGTLMSANAIIFGTQMNDSGTTGGYTESSGFTTLSNIADGFGDAQLTLAYQVVSSTAPVTYAPTINSGSGGDWCAIAAPFDILNPFDMCSGGMFCLP